MKDKIITIKSGIDLEQPEFKEYYQKIKQLGVQTCFLDLAINQSSEVLSNPIVLNGDDFDEFDIDDISFLWLDGKIIGHQFLSISKFRSSIQLGHNKGNHLDPKYMQNPGHRRKISRIEYYCELEGVQIPISEYCKDRTSGKLESEVVIPYEKQITIQRPQS